MKIALATLLFGCGAVFAQQVGPAESAAVIQPTGEINAPESLEVIFSNLGPRDDPYNANGQWVAVAGKRSSTDTEQWQAVRFSPKVDVQAQVLTAAIQFVSGVREVKLGLYDNNDITNSVGTLLPGGEGSTTDIPDLDDCCQLATVTLDGAGVTLSARKLYWLVLSSDDTNGASFTGRWRLAKRALSAAMAPPLPWGNQPGQWPATEIRGTRLQTAAPDKEANHAQPASGEATAPSANVTIFTNLDRTGEILYLYGIGGAVAGNDSSSSVEVWRALPFTPRKAVHVKTILAAIGHIAGTTKINLGLYSDNAGTVGTPLPGGQVSTTNIPESGFCCDLTKVTLPGAGVALAAGAQVWLVASPDNESAADFFGLWQDSNLAVRAYNQPEFFTGWTSLTGDWPAAEIRGTSP